ncbi:MAG: GNAT family N-acetyltransferase [Clostridia bacterium]
MKIRPYQPKDFENCREICYLTSQGFDTEKKKAALLNMFCDYYLEYEADTCFVAANDEDEAIGYIICADSYEEYEKNYRANYMKDLKKLSFFFWLVRDIELRMRRKLAKKFPAHLHINLKPGSQRQGAGHKLTDALLTELKSRGVSGIFLGVGAKNETGKRFYRKYGFTEYKRDVASIIFTIDINNWQPKV